MNCWELSAPGIWSRVCFVDDELVALVGNWCSVGTTVALVVVVVAVVLVALMNGEVAAESAERAEV